MTPAEVRGLLDEAERLDAEATPGPWFHDGDDPDAIDAHTPDGMAELVADCTSTRWANSTDNAAFIARSRTLVPLLARALADVAGRVERVERVEAKLERQRAAVNRDYEKLRAAQSAIDVMADGPEKEALTFAVLQWMHAGFISHEPLTAKERAFGMEVATRLGAAPPAGETKEPR